MNSSHRMALRAAVSMALVVAGTTVSGQVFAQAAREPIKLGFLSSFTGAANQSGFNGIVAVNMAVKEINAAGGILGRQVTVVQGPSPLTCLVELELRGGPSPPVSVFSPPPIVARPA